MNPYEKQERQERDRRIEASIQAQLDLDLMEALGSPGGRRLLWRLIFDAAKVHDRTFVPDALVSAHAEGKRAVGLWLLEQIEQVSPSDYVHMLAEGVSAQRAIEARAETLNAGDGPDPSE